MNGNFPVTVRNELTLDLALSNLLVVDIRGGPVVRGSPQERQKGPE